MFTNRVAFSNFTEPRWEALRPHLARVSPQGRSIGDLRHRMDGISHLIATDAPCREVPRHYGQAGSVALHFRRLTYAGLWERLLRALHYLPAGHPHQGLRPVIFRAARRAYRIRGLGIMVVARRLGFLGALPGPSWLVADPDLSKTLVQWQLAHRENFGAFVLQWGKTLRNLMGMVGGRPNIPRSVRLAMA